MEAKTGLRHWSGKIGGVTVAVAVCAFGRALDFATTWVAIGRGSAAEAEPLAKHVFDVLGFHTGLITYEAMITTPAIFLGCRLATHTFGKRPTDHAMSLGERMFFISIGVISLIVAAFNIQYAM
jgi:hypothetical protein